MGRRKEIEGKLGRNSQPGGGRPYRQFSPSQSVSLLKAPDLANVAINHPDYRSGTVTYSPISFQFFCRGDYEFDLPFYRGELFL